MNTEILLPFEPIATYVAGNGGIAKLPGMGREEWVEIEKPPYFRMTIERNEEEAWLYTRTRSRYNWLSRMSAPERWGGVKPEDADDFCCTYLGVHPIAVYGPDWYDLTDPEVQAELRAAAEAEAARADLVAA